MSVLEIGGGISAGSVSKTEHVGKERLQELLLKACANAKNGKGNDIILAVAGLPYAYSEIIRHEGCTYLRRATHSELGLFTWDETTDALKKLFQK